MCIRDRRRVHGEKIWDMFQGAFGNPFMMSANPASTGVPLPQPGITSELKSPSKKKKWPRDRDDRRPFQQKKDSSYEGYGRPSENMPPNQDSPLAEDSKGIRKGNYKGQKKGKSFGKGGRANKENIKNGGKSQAQKSLVNRQSFFKTKMCPNLQESGACPRGDKCSFAHSQSELKQPPNLKKTKLCQLFQMGRCQMGGLCSFAHGEDELRSTPDFYKTSMCNSFLKGACALGDRCRYAHGETELRAPQFLHQKTAEAAQSQPLPDISTLNVNPSMMMAFGIQSFGNTGMMMFPGSQPTPGVPSMWPGSFTLPSPAPSGQPSAP
eukprot:TRINITY_DN88_c0_g1_i3.p1 TRINITY_DN88_c0_g1~~TRINITY_DN88_c0_g1_i3.p1  ORF type:complete len:347 (+),score=85.98 TRINITY_DN88_c0_g1_i3:75-1043(+)